MGLHRQRCRRADLAAGLHQGLLPGEAECIDAVQRALPGAQRQLGIQLVDGRLVVDAQLADVQRVDLHCQRQVQIGRCHQRLATGRAAAVVHPLGRQQAQLQVKPTAGMRQPAQRPGLKDQRFSADLAGLAGQFPAQRCRLQPAAAPAALQALQRQARHLAQQPGQGGGVVVQQLPQPDGQGQRGQQQDTAQQPKHGAPTLAAGGGSRRRCGRWWRWWR